MTLLEQFEEHDWSAEGIDLLGRLMSASPTDEAALAVLGAAAMLLARQQPDATSAGPLSELMLEFADVVRAMQLQLRAASLPVLFVVGGTDTDVHPF